MPQWPTRAIFIAVGLALLLAVYSFIATSEKDKEKHLRAQKELELSNKMVELAEKEAQIADLSKEKTSLEEEFGLKVEKMEAQLKEDEEQLAKQREQIDSLTEDNESLMKDVVTKDKKISDLARQIDKLETDKDDLVKTIQLLEKEKEALPPPVAVVETSPYETQAAVLEGDPVKLGRIVVQKTSGRVAQVQHVNPSYGFVVINAGSNDGLKANSVVNIVRDKRIIGKAVVQKTRHDVSAALLLPEWTKTEVRVGDVISQF